MQIMIISESCFGNTDIIARAVARGLGEAAPEAEVVLVSAAQAASALPPGLGLLVVGAPTHNTRMPSRSTRVSAVDRGAPSDQGPGLREWIDRSTPLAEVPTYTFDTATQGFAAGSAAKAASKALRRRGWRRVERGESFRVTGTAGPLADGEEARAVQWGERLAEALQTPGA